MKTGIKTSEFWVAIVGAILAALSSSGHLPVDLPNDSILALVAYVISRGIAKFGKP